MKGMTKESKENVKLEAFRNAICKLLIFKKVLILSLFS